MTFPNWPAAIAFLSGELILGVLVGVGVYQGARALLRRWAAK